jgi:hypothetical protein
MAHPPIPYWLLNKATAHIPTLGRHKDLALVTNRQPYDVDDIIILAASWDDNLSCLAHFLMQCNTMQRNWFLSLRSKKAYGAENEGAMCKGGFI